LLAIVPFKGLDGAKTRLAAVLSSEERARLAFEMLERVLVACEGAVAIEQTLLVTPDPSAVPATAEVLVDSGVGHAEAIALALGDPRAAAGALVVMADCPLVQPASLDALAEAARPLALVQARDGGVNALALGDVAAFQPRFGVRAEQMIGEARAAGLEPAVLDDPALALDVDRPEDLAFA
jgi:2-phospho-L-lactate guanylyltransferase